MNGVVELILHRNTPLMIDNVHFIEKKIVKNIGLEKKNVKTKNYWNQNTGITGLNTHILNICYGLHVEM